MSIPILDQYKCEICKIVQDYVYTCQNHHLICDGCTKQLDHICKCKAVLITRTENPVCRQLKDVCAYYSAGCKWTFASKDMPDHLMECKYRPYKCVGNTLGAWICDWQGIQRDIEEHLKVCHANLGDYFQHFQVSSVLFDEKHTVASLNLINGFGNRFVFYYQSNVTTNMVYFIIYLLGRREEAEKYFIKFNIKSPREKFRKIKFIEKCYCDCDNICELISAEKCIAITHQTIRKYLDGDSINFRFVINRKDEDDKKPGVPGEDDKKSSSKENQRKENPFTFKNKGNLKANTVRKGSSIPSGNSGGGGGGGRVATNGNGGGGAGNNDAQSTGAGASISLNIESKSEEKSMKLLCSTPTSETSHPSSINRIISDGPTSPCYSPSINKDDLVEVKNGQVPNYQHFFSAPTAGAPPLQPYKAVDDYLYRTKYPKSSLGKPRLRK